MLKRAPLLGGGGAQSTHFPDPFSCRVEQMKRVQDNEADSLGITGTIRGKTAAHTRLGVTGNTWHSGNMHTQEEKKKLLTFPSIVSSGQHKEIHHTWLNIRPACAHRGPEKLFLPQPMYWTLQIPSVGHTHTHLLEGKSEDNSLLLKTERPSYSAARVSSSDTVSEECLHTNSCISSLISRYHLTHWVPGPFLRHCRCWILGTLKTFKCFNCTCEENWLNDDVTASSMPTWKI